MNAKLTDITVVLDRSGSMAACRAEAESGLNQFVKAQKEKAADAAFTLVQFDHEYEVVHDAKPIRDVPHCSLVPSGTTALLDALGRTIISTGKRLEATPEDKRPGLVVFVILTDGHENASREFKMAQIKEMVEHQREKYGWQFTYLGANQDAFTEAHGMGIPVAASANYVGQSTDKAFAAAASNLSRMQCAVASCGPVVNTYSDQEREEIAK